MTEETVPEILDYEYAADLYTLIQKGFGSSDSFALDLSHVQRASLSCLQVLVAAKRSAKANTFDFTVSLSDSLQQAMKDLGLDSFFTAEGKA